MTAFSAIGAVGLVVAGLNLGALASVTNGCTANGNLAGVAAVCETEGEVIQQTIATAPTGTVYRTAVQCTQEQINGACYNPRACLDPPGTLRYDVLRSTDNGVNFTKVSETCLGPDAGTDPPPQITPDLVATRFRELSWPTSPLQIQPPGGRTLVNLATNFLTTNTTPTSQQVELLGQQVEIEATPSTWTWHHGDETSQTTDRPGRAYPHLDVTHTYASADTVTPSLDTTYTGRYRVNAGPWIAIPSTVTVAGPPAQLDVVTADPQLVGTS